jgi:hypothetical protein
MKKNSKSLKHGHSEFYTMKTSKTCALLLPKKMVLKEQCGALSLKDEYLQNISQQQKPAIQLARILDPQWQSSIQKNPSGDLSAGTQ